MSSSRLMIMLQYIELSPHPVGADNCYSVMINCMHMIDSFSNDFIIGHFSHLLRLFSVSLVTPAHVGNQRRTVSKSDIENNYNWHTA